jgi:hypothetical protein
MEVSSMSRRDLKTHCINGHEFKPGSFRRTRKGYRICTVCLNARAIARYRKRREGIPPKPEFVPTIPEGLKIPTVCSKGHPVTLATTRIISGRWFQCRTCRTGYMQKFHAKEATETEVRNVITALRAGRTLTDCYGIRAGKVSTRDALVDAKHMANFMRAHPKIRAKIKALAREVAYPIRLEAGRKATLTRTGRAPIIVAAPAIIRNDGRDAWEAVRRAVQYLPDDEQGDVMGLMFVAIGEGKLRLADCAARVKEFGKAHRYRPRVYGDRSLDAPLYDDGFLTLGDTVTHGLWQ